MKTKTELQESLSLLIEEKKEIKRKIVEVENEMANIYIDPSDYEDNYREMLNDCYIGVFGILPATILQECDPVAYRCGLNDYCDNIDIEDTEQYINLSAVLDDLEDKWHEIELEIDEIESEIND